MSDPRAIVLLIEDEPRERAVLHVMLRDDGYTCIHACNGRDGVRAALDRAPSVVLLDVGLPDIDGIEVTRRIRARSQVPIVVVSAHGQEDLKVQALDEGANDYVTKPFAPGELRARIRVALRHAEADARPPEAGTFTVGELTVDFDSRRVTRAGTEVRLTPIEYRLLGVMIRSAGRLLSNRELLRQVWGPQFDTQDGYLRIYMSKLRNKLESEPARPRYLQNEPGVGYRLRLPD